MESVRLAGGEPWILDPARDHALIVVDRADRVLLTGGGDVHPSRYAATAHPAFSPAEPGRDDFELTLARLAVETDTPLLAICRGLQVLNVARGGSLFQHLPDEHPSDTPHEVRETPTSLAHDISVEPGSLLASALPPRQLPVWRVNSRHHQAVRVLGEGLVAAALAPDAIVEAIEDRSRRFCLGVQWHPENFWRTGEFHTLFTALMAGGAG